MPVNSRVLEEETYDSILEVEAYGEVVSRYAAISHNWIVEQVLNYGSPGALLDIGAGTGHVVAQLAEYDVFDSLTAVDSSSVMLEMAEKKVEEAGVVERVKFAKADATALPFADDSFDTVICHNTLHHFADPTALLREVLRVTKPDGQFFIRDMHRVHPAMMILVERLIFLFAGSSRKQSVDSLKAALSYSELQELASQFPGVVAIRKGFVHVSVQKSKMRTPRTPYIKVGPWWARPLSYFKV